MKGDYLTRLLPVGSTRIVSGRVERFNNEIRINHPDYIVAPDARESLPLIEPVYGLTAGLPLRTVQKGVATALAKAPDLGEWIDPGLKKQRQWPDWKPALLTAHAPTSEADLSPTTPPRTRLAYDELLASQLAICCCCAHTRRLAGRAIKVKGKAARRAVTKSLPFSLTHSQRHALAEIAGDMAAPNRMLRLLQGDVGSGKTVVALMAMLDVVESGAQAALMAPTEILARQHYAAHAGCAGGARRGRGRAAHRAREGQDTRQHLATPRLGRYRHCRRHPCAVLRGCRVQGPRARGDRRAATAFGVEQRIALSSKGKGVDILVMTATPIPRTLMLTAYGDLDSSRLTEKPAGRKPVTTRTIPLARLDEVIEAVRRALGQGAKIYWICPLVEESEQLDIAAAEESASPSSRRDCSASASRWFTAASRARRKTA